MTLLLSLALIVTTWSALLYAGSVVAHNRGQFEEVQKLHSALSVSLFVTGATWLAYAMSVLTR